MRMTTLTGYSDQISVAGGQTIRFMVNSADGAPYQAQLVRVVCGDMNPAGPGYREVEIDCPINGTHPGRPQRIDAGSCILVPHAPALEDLAGFTIQAAIMPTTPGQGEPGAEQVLLSHWDAGRKAGFELILTAQGAAALRLGDGAGGVETVATTRPLHAGQWAFVAAGYDPAARRAFVHQIDRTGWRPDAATDTVEASVEVAPAAATGAPLMMAARLLAAAPRRTEAHYNGRIEAPRLFGRALSLAEAEAAAVVPGHLRAELRGAWDFARDISGTRIDDISGNGLHGETINLPTRAVTGQHWTGGEMCWQAAPDQYAAIHFHDDDVYDAGWEVDFELTVPEELRSGSYAVRIRAGASEEYMPFFVRRPTGRPTAKILYLAPTATYLAYANLGITFGPSGGEMLANRLIAIQPWEEYLNAHPEYGASLYDLHSDGTGVSISSRLRPVLNMRPKVQTPTAGHGSMVWAYNADTHLTDWLEAQGFDFDVATDEDLHREGAALLRHYKVVLTATHPEYYSAAMRQGLEDYTARGGRLMYMGGNGFYWRVAYHQTLPGVMEVRRSEDGTRAWMAKPGEYYHAFTGEYGGLWRRQDKPPQTLVGTGFIAQGFDHSTGYRRTAQSHDPRVAFAFEGIPDDATIGDFGLVGGGAAGLEVDIADPTLGTPRHALVVAISDELPDTFLLVNEEQTIATPDTLGTTNPRIRSDLVFFETGEGGAVFSFSSMAWCASLSHNGYDNNVSRLTGNVLRRFAEDAPL